MIPAQTSFPRNAGATREDVIAPLPRITLQAFCETSVIASVMQTVAADRRMSKAQIRIQMGGPAAAVEAFRAASTPNVIVVEAQSDAATLVVHLDNLAERCDPDTKVVVIGHVNDVPLYRDLIMRGVSEYLIAPLEPLQLVRRLSGLYGEIGGRALGRIISVIGAKGGVGSSTLAHNVASAIALDLDASTVIVDLDIAFGTAGLNFDQDHAQGIAEAVFAPERLDANMLDRLLTPCNGNLALLAAPAILDHPPDLREEGLDQLLGLLRACAPWVVLDLPHLWSGWVKRTLIDSDEIVIVATPELASLRNTKNLVDMMRINRPNDPMPWLVLNQVGLPKRPEINASDFTKALGLEVLSSIPFSAEVFGEAASNGRMLAQTQAGRKISDRIVASAGVITGRNSKNNCKTNLLRRLIDSAMRSRNTNKNQ
jgi:pilus assembly protein CpaE